MIKRSRRRNNFSVLNNEIFASNSLSFEAMGLLSFLLSKPDDWEVSVKALSKSTDGTAQRRGVGKIYALLKELINAGFVSGEKHADGTVDYTVFDEAQEKPDLEKPDLEKPDLEKPDLENRDVLIRTERQLRTEEEVSTDSHKSANAQCERENPNPPPLGRKKYPDGFERFWQAYTTAPDGCTARVGGKAQALKIWQRNKLEKRADKLIAIVQQFWRLDHNWRTGYHPMASTWLNQERYEDEPQPAIKKKGGSSWAEAKEAAERKRLDEIQQWIDTPSSETGIEGRRKRRRERGVIEGTCRDANTYTDIMTQIGQGRN